MRETVCGAQLFELCAFTNGMVDILKQAVDLNRTATVVQGWIQRQSVPVFGRASQ